jgi:hypothetical protein
MAKKRADDGFVAAAYQEKAGAAEGGSKASYWSGL